MDPKRPDPIFHNSPTPKVNSPSIPMEIKRKEDSHCGAPLGHLDFGNDEPKVPIVGNLSTSHSDMMVNVQGVDKALNASDISHGKTSQLPSLSFLNFIYLEENMSDLL